MDETDYDELENRLEHMMTGLIREVHERGIAGRWQLRYGLERALNYAEFQLRPLRQKTQTDGTLRQASQLVLASFRSAMEDVFPDQDARLEAQAAMGTWFKASQEIAPHDIEDYLNAIASNVVRSRVA